MMYTRNSKKTPLISILLLLSAFVFFTACDTGDEKVDVNFDEEEQSAYMAEESTENLFDVIESITNSAVKYPDSNSGGRIAESTDPELACAKLDFTGDKQSGRLQIDFGDGCQGPDGKTRKGIIVVEYDGHWLTPGAEIYTILKNFYIDDIKIEGTRILTNVSLDMESLVYTVEIVEGKVTWPDETFITRESDRIHTLVFGSGFDDFELHVEGVASGKTKLGVEYVAKTLEPLVFKSSCRGNTIYLPASGIKTITIPEKPVITINHGNGDCDNKMTISIGEESKEVII